MPTVATANSEDTFASEDQPSKLGMWSGSFPTGFRLILDPNHQGKQQINKNIYLEKKLI